MRQKRTYYGYSTRQQRRLLFEEWEATGNITKACQKARVSRGLFYYWKPRFDEKGYAGLDEFESRAPRKAKSKDDAVERRVIELRRENPDWGKTRIADEMAKANNWVPIVSPNTVRRILKDANLWPDSSSGGKRSTQDSSSHSRRTRPNDQRGYLLCS